jgi:WD40 repeat protein
MEYLLQILFTLEYSIDRCSSWMLITKKATGLKYIWENIPNTVSDNCLLRIRRFKDFETGKKNSSQVLFHQGVRAFAAAYSPNGRYIVSGDANGNCILWDVIENKLVRNIKCHKGEIYGINWDKESSKFISSASDGTTIIYNIYNKTLIGPFQSNGGWSNFADFNPKNCDEFAVGCSNGSIKIWSITKNKIKFNILGHSALVHQVSYSPDGKSIASAGYDSKVKIWNVDDASPIATLDKHSAAVYCALWSHDGSKLASSSGVGDLTIKIWDTTDWSLIKDLVGHQNKINSCVWSPNDKTIISSDDNDHIMKWDVEKGFLTDDYIGQCNGIYYADWSPFGGRFVSAGLNGDVKIWEKDTVKFVEDISDTLWSIIPTKNIPCGQTAFKYDNFNNTNTLSLIGDAIQIGDSVLMTNAKFFNRSAIWHKNKVKIDKGFNIEYSFNIEKCDNKDSFDGSLPGADGLALVLQNNSIYELGGNGGGIGYSGIKKGVAFELDLFRNLIDFADDNGNHFAFQYTNGDSLSPSHLKNSIVNNSILIIKHNINY